ncbi:MAG: hypothetical protein ABSF38_08085 [Verrucomicrobiota bacterium]
MDQPCAAKVNIECCKLTLSSFIARKSRLRCPIRKASLKAAWFEAPIPGRFSLPADIKTDALKIDELWAKVGCPQKNAPQGEDERGDFCAFLALAAREKFIVRYRT